MKILYFAWLKSRTGTGMEELDPPAGVEDVRGLVEWLRGRSPGHAAALADMETVRVAVNQEHTGIDQTIGPDDEIAFFPPMTGG